MGEIREIFCTPLLAIERALIFVTEALFLGIIDNSMHLPI